MSAGRLVPSCLVLLKTIPDVKFEWNVFYILTRKSMRYIGCKQKLLPSIQATIDKLLPESGIVIDAFAGTGTVSESLKTKHTVVASDLLLSSVILTKCKICLKKESLSLSLESVFETLNQLPPVEGFIWNTYTPKGGRMYFTEQNGKKIDAILHCLHEWKESNRITELDSIFLLGCLLECVSLVANTAGTYGAYNKKWDPRAEKPLTLHNPFALEGSDLNEVHHCDAATLVAQQECDVLYMDPPYNARQYGSYYHVLETIARNDKPTVHGVTGMRDWSDTKSKFCIQKEVADELETIVKLSKARYVVMSYNNEGLLDKESIVKILGQYGTVECEEIPYDRYSRVTAGKSNVVEYLFTLQRMETVPPVLNTWYNKLYHEECLEGMKRIPDKSVHMILTDLPYGLTECKWDSIIPLDQLWKEYKRIIVPTGAIVLFGQQPFTSVLIASNLELFKYSLVWKKTKTGNFAQAPYRFLCQHEDIAVFSFGKVAKNGNPRMSYYPQGTVPCNKVMKGKSGATEHREGRATQSDYVQTVTNYPRSILEFANESKPEHPTQKPVDLCEYLIKSYTQEGEIVLDSCMGSGTTAVAALQSKRKYVGFEKEKSYYDYALQRISKTSS